MEWIILFIVSWGLFFLLVDWKTLKRNVWCGLFATSIQLFVDNQFINIKLYIIKNQIINILGSSLFFVCGPIFVIGVLLAQYQPNKKSLRIAHVIVLSSLYSIQELLILSRRSLIYINWHHINSIGVNISAIALLSWFAIVVLEKERN